MASGLELRVPYLDHNLAGAAYRIPTDKMILRGILKTMPRTIRSRYYGVEGKLKQKHYVATPQREWIRNYLDGRLLVRNLIIDEKTFWLDYENYIHSEKLGNSFSYEKC